MTSHNLPPVPPASPPAASPALSALADGQVDDLTDAMHAWRHEPTARQAWHTYQLIGDVMRSEDLAQTPAHDLDFLNRLRTQLDKEPAWLIKEPAEAVAEAGHAAASGATAVVMAAAVTQQRVRPQWHSGALAAASVAAVALVLWVVRPGFVAGPGESATVATAGPAQSAPVNVLGPEQAPMLQGAVLRDPRLDEFLRVHQMARGGLPVGVPGGTLQRADLQMTVGAGR